MEGPTPVVRVHAATMVTAGIYMVARVATMSTAAHALGVIAIIGAATVDLFAACIGMVHTDIKRVLAYSTVSQLGYMFLACGVGAYAAGIFHLLTHAFSRALLFLACSRSVSHALSGEQDMSARWAAFAMHSHHLLDDDLMGVFAIAGIPVGRLLLQRRDPLPGIPSPFTKFFLLARRPRHSRNDIVLYVPSVVQDILRPENFKERADLHDDEPPVTSSGSHAVSWSPTPRKTTCTVSTNPPGSCSAPLVILAIFFIGGWVRHPHRNVGPTMTFGHFLEPVFTNGATAEAATATASAASNSAWRGFQSLLPR